MKQVIYGDVFFLVNFSMDFLALYLTAKLSHASLTFWRLVLGGALGGLYATVALFLPSSVEAFATLLFPFLLSAVVFGVSRVTALVKRALLFFAVSFVMGGVMTAVYYYAGRLLSEKGIYINGEVETVYSDLPLWAVGLCAAWAAFIASVFSRYAKKKASCRSAVLTLSDGGRCVTLSSLVDSGHFLEEPIGHLPVIVVTKKTMESLLPPGFLPDFLNFAADLSRLSEKERLKFRFVPIVTVGHEGLLRGYLPDSVLVAGEEKKALVVCDETAEDFEGFEAILPPSLLS
ncbi:MAG: sigma-E processing peptidase SpoIIGA [Clostridia bacterium]|nr:sigma-E processing peptidase SpoIIGA [Clostridia bacterium]